MNSKKLECEVIDWTNKNKKFHKEVKHVIIYKGNERLNLYLKGSFTHKQNAWEPPLNHSWKFELWPLQTGVLKINAGFAEKKPKKVVKITRTPTESHPSDFSLRFLSCKSYFSAEFGKIYLEKVVVLSEAFLLVYDTWWYLNIKYDFLCSKGRNQGKNH